MDYIGQRNAERTIIVLLILFGIPGWIYGYLHQSFMYTFYAWAMAMTLAAIIVLPNWPIFNRNQIKWRSKKND